MAKETESSQLVIIDTNIFIDYLRNHHFAIKYIQGIDQEERKKIFFSVITETELMSGQSCNNSTIRTGVIDMLNNFKKIEITSHMALKAGDICRTYGLTIPDALIAASAILHNATLMTKNTKDFKHIPNLKIKEPY